MATNNGVEAGRSFRVLAQNRLWDEVEGQPANETKSGPGKQESSRAGSEHPGVVQVAMTDGSVQTISDPIDLATWRALATRAGGEVASP